jgi:hypothetical protein
MTTMLLGFSIELAEFEACLGPGDLSLRVDVDRQQVATEPLFGVLYRCGIEHGIIPPESSLNRRVAAVKSMLSASRREVLKAPSNFAEEMLNLF